MNKIQINKEVIEPIYNKTKSINKTAQELKINWSTCNRILIEHRILNSAYNKQTDVLNAFSLIQNEEDAYWLGMMYTDGWIRSDRNSIGLGSVDIDVIEGFKKYIGKDNLITVKLGKDQIGKPLPRGRTVKTAKDFYTYEFSSKRTKENLIKLGCMPKKSLILQCPTIEQVPEHLLWHFFRGCVDGDGWIATKHFSFGLLGTQHFLEVLLTRLGILHYGYLRKKDEGKVWEFSITTKKVGLMVLEKLYKEATVFMKRKHDKFLFLIGRSPI